MTNNSPTPNAPLPRPLPESEHERAVEAAIERFRGDAIQLALICEPPGCNDAEYQSGMASVTAAKDALKALMRRSPGGDDARLRELQSWISNHQFAEDGAGADVVNALEMHQEIDKLLARPAPTDAERLGVVDAIAQECGRLNARGFSGDYVIDSIRGIIEAHSSGEAQPPAPEAGLLGRLRERVEMMRVRAQQDRRMEAMSAYDAVVAWMDGLAESAAPAGGEEQDQPPTDIEVLRSWFKCKHPECGDLLCGAQTIRDEHARFAKERDDARRQLAEAQADYGKLSDQLFAARRALDAGVGETLASVVDRTVKQLAEAEKKLAEVTRERDEARIERKEAVNSAIRVGEDADNLAKQLAAARADANGVAVRELEDVVRSLRMTANLTSGPEHTHVPVANVRTDIGSVRRAIARLTAPSEGAGRGAEECEATCGTKTCVLPRDHGGTYHQSRSGSVWPSAAAFPTDEELRAVTQKDVADGLRAMTLGVLDQHISTMEHAENPGGEWFRSATYAIDALRDLVADLAAERRELARDGGGK
jgi:predicted  nucleic acid-binding Zn-ribbon protein